MITKKSKYNAQALWYNPIIHKVVSSAFYNLEHKLEGNKEDYIYFPSRLELRVYLLLIDHFGIGRVRRQVKVLIVPAGLCYPRGLYWAADFAVLHEHLAHRVPDWHSIQYLVEAKGMVGERFRLQLALLEQFQPEYFDKLYVVFDKKVPKDVDVIKNLCKTAMVDRLITHTEANWRFKALVKRQQLCIEQLKKESEQWEKTKKRKSLRY